MLSTLLLASSLSFGSFPEVPVGPATPPVAQQDEAPPLPDGDTFDPDEAERDRAEAEDRAARDRAMRDVDGDRSEEGDWAKEDKKHRAPGVEFRALATTLLPIRIGRVPTSGDMLVGLRGELDIGHASALFSWDRGASSLFDWRNTLTPTSYWNALIGPSVWATKHNRIRLLGGVSAVSTDRRDSFVVSQGTGGSSTARSSSGVQFGPTIGTTVHLGIPVIGVEAAVLYTPVSFQQVDARAEVVLRLLIFEVRGGYRARWIDTSRSSTGVPVESVYGPTVSLGLVF